MVYASSSEVQTLSCAFFFSSVLNTDVDGFLEHVPMVSFLSFFLLLSFRRISERLMLDRPCLALQQQPPALHLPQALSTKAAAIFNSWFEAVKSLTLSTSSKWHYLERFVRNE